MKDLVKIESFDFLLLEQILKMSVIFVMLFKEKNLFSLQILFSKVCEKKII